MTEEMNQKNEPKDIEYFYEKNRFLNLFMTTKKYHDLWKSKNALFCFLLSILITILLLFLYGETEVEVERIIEAVRAITLTISGGFFSLLGLIVGGLALITASIGNDVIGKINEKKKIEDLISVIFNFYFSGVLTGFTLIFSIITYLVTFIPLEFRLCLFIPWSFFLSYMVMFSIVYAVMLLGTCIRIFLMRYYYLSQ